MLITNDIHVQGDDETFIQKNRDMLQLLFFLKRTLLNCPLLACEVTDPKEDPLLNTDVADGRLPNDGFLV